MKQLFTLLITAISLGAFAQNDVKITEESVSYSAGSKNSIVVTIPYGNYDVVVKELKSEMKSWGGKLKSSKTEYTTLQSSMKNFFERKTFDAYGKTIKNGDVVSVAVAIDLGGAFMTSSQHATQFTEMKEILRQFAIKAGKASLKDEIKVQEKVLAGYEKEQKSLEKEKESHLKEIEGYKKKIEESQKKIEDNVVLQTKKKEEVKTQSSKIKAMENLNLK